MSVLIVGSEGKMGRRYQAILRSLYKDYICFDKRKDNEKFESFKELTWVDCHSFHTWSDFVSEENFKWDKVTTHLNLDHVTGIILCTPTETHFELLKQLIPLKKPILCEKPVTKNIEEMEQIADLVLQHSTPFRMVCQYTMLTNSEDFGLSHYDYYNHGADGLVWDCFQIIGLANSGVSLEEKSPIWDCAINGRKLSLADMDRAYIDYVAKWLKEPNQDINEILEIHRKVNSFEKDFENARSS